MRFQFMRIIRLFFFLLLLPANAQDLPLELRIDSIKTEDAAKERKYTIVYHLTNLTDKKLSFFQKPENLISNNGGSMSNCPYYKIYEGDKFLNLGTVFNRPDKSNPHPNRIEINSKDKTKNAEAMKWLRENFVVDGEIIKELKETGKISRVETVTDSLYMEFLEGNYMPKKFEFKKRPVMDDVMTLEPHETKTFTQTGYWDKDRYFFHDPEEFYLNEKAKHYFEITFVMLKEHLKSRLTSEEYDKIMADENFIKGVFVSNKMEIDFY